MNSARLAPPIVNDYGPSTHLGGVDQTPATIVPSISTTIPHIERDWSDPSIIMSMPDDAPPITQHQLATVHQKFQLTPRFETYWANHPDLVAQQILIANSDYPDRTNVVLCRQVKADYTSTFRCQHRLFCPVCCRDNAYELAVPFRAALSRCSEAWLVTLSVSHDPDERNRFAIIDPVANKSVAHFKDGEDDDHFPFSDRMLLWHLVLRVFIDAFRTFCLGGVFAGAIGGPQIGIRFSPLRCIAHVHFVCFSEGVSEDDFRELRDHARQGLRAIRRFIDPELFPCVYPDLDARRLPGADDVQKALRYLWNPIDIATPYILAYPPVANDPGSVADLNRDVNAVLQAVHLTFAGLKRINRFGGCHASCKQYLGVKSRR